MRLTPKHIFQLIVFLFLINTAIAQNYRTTDPPKPGPTVTAVASFDRVRFAAPPSVFQIRLEVYDATGKKLFDNEVRGGNVIDWLIQDGQASRLQDGEYLCVVTIKSISGRLAQRIGSMGLKTIPPICRESIRSS